MSAKLDRKRPFGQVYGPADHAYEQDGKLFDHEGEEVVGAEELARRKAEELNATKDKEPAGEDAKLLTILEGSNAKVLEALPDLSEDELNRAAALETQGKSRVGTLKAIAEELVRRKPADSQLQNQLQD